MPFGIPASVIGLIVKGDLAGQTIYTDRFGKKVYFTQAPPEKPPSEMQVRQRQRFATAIDNWRAASLSTRAHYESVSLLASLCMTGLNLWIHASLKCDDTFIATLSRQTGVDLTPPPCVPWDPG